MTGFSSKDFPGDRLPGTFSARSIAIFWLDHISVFRWKNGSYFFVNIYHVYNQQSTQDFIPVDNGGNARIHQKAVKGGKVRMGGRIDGWFRAGL
jgi:hypothetical protein